MLKDFHVGVAALTLTVFVTGCGGPGTVHKPFTLGENTAGLAVDARQRAIMEFETQHDATLGVIVPSHIVCAEPSPDVAVAVAEALAFSLSGGVGAAGNAQAGAGLGRQISEGLLSLDREATVQLLRDGLYRACEAYANGAITSTTYAMITAGVNDMFVTLLAAEAAAGGLRVGESSVVVQAGNVTVESSAAAPEGEEDPEAANREEIGSAGATVQIGEGAKGASNNQAGQVAQQIAAMLEDFLTTNKADRQPLVAACVSAMDRHENHPLAKSSFASFCNRNLERLVGLSQNQPPGGAQS